MPQRRDPDDIDDLTRDLSQALAGIPKNTKPTVPAQNGQRPHMALPPGLVEESAKMLFEFWEREAQRAGHRDAIAWERLSPQFQVAWLEITRVVLEMSTTVLLNDLNHFLDSSNGDMGAAFSRALQRYATTVLQSHIRR